MLVTIPLRFSNAYLVKGQQPVLIDSGSPGDEARIIRALDAHRFSLRDLRLIIHTHAHMDHAGSTAALIQKAGIPALIHARDYDNLVSGKNGEIIHHSFMGWLVKKFIVKEYDPVRPTSFSKRDRSHDFGMMVLVHTPDTPSVRYISMVMR
jgi:glyoxylase-like metal-dependent hydrolase (beta-lactamase superfamily II)